MDAILLNGNGFKPIYFSMQLSKVSVLVVILHADVCAAGKPVSLCVLHYTVVNIVERVLEIPPVILPRESMKLIIRTN